MTFTQLRVLQAVARTGNMTRAAEQLTTTQSAVSHALRGLENELGIALLVRAHRSVSLTSAGRAVLRRATLILTQIEALEQDVAAAKGQNRGSLRIGAIPSANARLLPPLLRTFGQAYPRVELVVMEGSDDEAVEWLQTGAADIATVTRTPPGLVTHLLATDRLLAVLPSEHELSVQHSISVTQLARHPFIMSTGGCEPLITALADDADVILRCHYRVRDMNSILAMVAEGLGVSIIPELSLPAHRANVHAIPIEPATERAILLAVPPDPLPAATAFAELAAAATATRHHGRAEHSPRVE
ncbi:LysR family transcriptional regulator [Nocardia wallacei]|uniref:LysR family transcriptional regulator n=1 Tax=Nocardia wallacei TaxID=480035 RepID=UPI002453AA9A|nr:LysR family transcriptional regulator [Nocardia wallacei]